MGEPVGCVALLRHGSSEGEDAGGDASTAPAVGWELAKLGVKLDFRRKGVATRLLEAVSRQVEEAAREGQAMYFEVRSGTSLGAEAQAFFQKIGFEESEQLSPEDSRRFVLRRGGGARG